MDLPGAGRRSYLRASYGQFFNPYTAHVPLESQDALNPNSPVSPLPPSPNPTSRPIKSAYTVDSLASPPEGKEFSYSNINLTSYGDTKSPHTALARNATFEQPKPAIYTGFWDNSPKFIPHIIAIGVTVAVVQLSFRNHYWMDLRDPSYEILPGITQGGALNALQLAAKLHELIVVASLGKIVLHVAQDHLVGRAGLPLGLITNSFSIGSGDFLWTKAYWKSILTIKNNHWRFWLVSLLATLLAMLAGPSSAIAVIPSLNWYPLNYPFQEEVLPFYIFNQSTVLWPSNITAASLNGPDSGINCTIATTSTAYQDVCPAGGFRDTYEWAGNLLFANSSAGTNISFSDAHGESRRVVKTQSCDSNFDGRASGLSLNTFLSGAVTSFWSFAKNNFHGLGLLTAQPRITFQGPLYAPRVEVMCNGYVYYNTSMIESRVPVNFPSFTPDRQLPSPDYIFPYNGIFNATNVTWVSMPAGSDNPSIGIVIRVPFTYGNGSATNIAQATEIHACSIYAQWVPVEVYYEPRQQDQVSYRVKNKVKETCLPIGKEEPRESLPPKNASIDMDYANAINQPMPFSDGPLPAIDAMLERMVFEDDRLAGNETGYTFKAPLVSISTVNGTTNTTLDDTRKSHSTMIGTILAGVVTDGLARIAGNGIFPYSASMFLTNETTDSGSLVGRFVISSAHGGDDNALNATGTAASDWLRVDPVFSRYGYGYDWKDSRTTQFGIVVLLIHFLFASVHIAVILYKVLIAGEGLVGSWTTISELLALAMNSTPSPYLQDTCAGVDAAKTWRQVVSVRETYTDHLEMVVGATDKAKYPGPQANRVYGHLRARQRAPGSSSGFQ